MLLLLGQTQDDFYLTLMQHIQLTISTEDTKQSGEQINSEPVLK